jgi:hypothetical protein
MRASSNPGKTHYQVMGYADKPGAVVVGSDIFTVAISFTPEGSGALIVVADTPDGGRTFLGLRQRQSGELEHFQPGVFDVVDVEHAFLREMWAAWMADKEAGKGE